MQTLTFNASLPAATTQPAPKIEAYLPETDRRNGAAIIIFPGGAYRGHAEHEGKGYAEYFVQGGYSCFVVEYRVGTNGHHHPAMLEDALAAIATIRTRAEEFGVNPAKIGVMGSSAGGHLAAHTMVAYEQVTSAVSLRPDFGILCYPVITMSGAHCHTGSRTMLHGGEPTAEAAIATSPELHVTAKTPPCFLWHTQEDPSVPPRNSLAFAGALDAEGVAYELHIYQKGGHGLGLTAPYNWGGECLRWLSQTLATDNR